MQLIDIFEEPEGYYIVLEVRSLQLSRGKLLRWMTNCIHAFENLSIREGVYDKHMHVHTHGSPELVLPVHCSS